MGEGDASSGLLVFFTGAGISTGAGLPTYRGAGGLYESGTLQPPSVDDVTSDRLPALWERFRPRLTAYDEIRPARAHQAIARLEAALPDEVVVVTQNVDGLHSLAGSTRVIELHGSLRRIRCLDRGHLHDVRRAAWPSGDVPRCPDCGAICRPDIVLFGEPLPSGAFRRAGQVMRRAATVVAVGTSAVVFPAAALIGDEYLAGTERIWVNPQTPPPSPGWTWLRGAADEEVTRLAGDIGQERG